MNLEQIARCEKIAAAIAYGEGEKRLTIEHGYSPVGHKLRWNAYIQGVEGGAGPTPEDAVDDLLRRLEGRASALAGRLAECVTDRAVGR